LIFQKNFTIFLQQNTNHSATKNIFGISVNSLNIPTLSKKN